MSMNIFWGIMNMSERQNSSKRAHFSRDNPQSKEQSSSPEKRLFLKTTTLDQRNMVSMKDNFLLTIADIDPNRKFSN
jgi:hypothetical protein